MTHVEGARQVDGDYLVPVLRVGVEKLSVLVPARVIDQDFTGTHVVPKLPKGRFDNGVVGDVRGVRRCLAAGSFDALCRLGGRIAVYVEDSDPHPSSPNRREIARPIAPPPPVTIAFLPVKPRMPGLHLLKARLLRDVVDS